MGKPASTPDHLTTARVSDSTLSAALLAEADQTDDARQRAAYLAMYAATRNLISVDLAECLVADAMTGDLTGAEDALAHCGARAGFDAYAALSATESAR
jgi:hypothetical protein